MQRLPGASIAALLVATAACSSKAPDPAPATPPVAVGDDVRPRGGALKSDPWALEPLSPPDSTVCTFAPKLDAVVPVAVPADHVTMVRIDDGRTMLVDTASGAVRARIVDLRTHEVSAPVDLGPLGSRESIAARALADGIVEVSWTNADVYDLRTHARFYAFGRWSPRFGDGKSSLWSSLSPAGSPVVYSTFTLTRWVPATGAIAHWPTAGGRLYFIDDDTFAEATITNTQTTVTLHAPAGTRVDVAERSATLQEIGDGRLLAYSVDWVSHGKNRVHARVWSAADGFGPEEVVSQSDVGENVLQPRAHDPQPLAFLHLGKAPISFVGWVGDCPATTPCLFHAVQRDLVGGAWSPPRSLGLPDQTAYGEPFFEQRADGATVGFVGPDQAQLVTFRGGAQSGVVTMPARLDDDIADALGDAGLWLLDVSSPQHLGYAPGSALSSTDPVTLSVTSLASGPLYALFDPYVNHGKVVVPHIVYGARGALLWTQRNGWDPTCGATIAHAGSAGIDDVRSIGDCNSTRASDPTVSSGPHATSFATVVVPSDGSAPKLRIDAFDDAGAGAPIELPMSPAIVSTPGWERALPGPQMQTIGCGGVVLFPAEDGNARLAIVRGA